MAFRGRGRGGRGRGGGFGFMHPAKHEEYKNFPEINVPEMTCAKASNDEKLLLHSTLKFEEFWKTSCYHLEEDAPKKSTITKLNSYNLYCFLIHCNDCPCVLSFLFLLIMRFLLVLDEGKQAIRNFDGIKTQMSKHLKYLRSLNRPTRQELHSYI
ncbi:hypothetical protein PR202_gb21607 [Eleusine coracana subsp. coracana]|uniref:Uncharacterized protein n=1 Tax=Eleusine coracana subsp. coracana TaxID=191504 RepID=A0AAV5FDL8_ELECO|nr:hypothetical protein PR202_gb21607 [Eleusine coracana subsp. coracana]